MQSPFSYADYYSSSAYAPYLREVRLAGDAGEMIEAAQPEGDFSDPPVRDLVLIRALSDGLAQRSDLGGGRFTARSPAGTLFLVPPQTATEILVHTPHAIRALAFPVPKLRPHLEAARPGREPFDFGRLHAGPFQNPLVLSLMDRLWSGAERAGPVSRLFAEGLVIAMLAELAHLAETKPEPPRGGLAPYKLKRVCGYLMDHLAEDVSLAELAALADLSTFHFCRAFKQSTGLPPYRWRHERRIERAKSLLETTKLSVTEVAAAVGYEDPTQLAAAFRKSVGMSPSAYRRARTS